MVQEMENGLIAIEDIKRRHQGHWFSASAMRFFNSRTAQTAVVKDGKAYFVSSEQFDYSSPRLFSVRVYDFATDDIDTVGEFQEYKTAYLAEKAIKQLVS